MNIRTLRFCLVKNFHTPSKKTSPITIMRHAESVWNANERRVQGASTNPEIVLSESGKLSIQSTLKNITKPDILITSPLLRCKQTAEVWFGCSFENIPVQKKVKPDLEEIHAGIYEERFIRELTHDELWKAWLKNPLTFSGFPNGETSQAFQDRVLNAFSKICSEHGDRAEQVCVITHGIVMRVLKCYLDNKDLSHLWDYDVANLERIILTNDQVNVLLCYSSVRDPERFPPPVRTCAL
ncbi:MAG TPA: histidine phosphatase family protein [Gammaproteobacteria bacterium]|nr:histidine phosphatase family protein [Gammaproteobacteria bacterium]